jgi:hypothetical protein
VTPVTVSAAVWVVLWTGLVDGLAGLLDGTAGRRAGLTDRAAGRIGRACTALPAVSPAP